MDWFSKKQTFPLESIPRFFKINVENAVQNAGRKRDINSSPEAVCNYVFHDWRLL